MKNSENLSFDIPGVLLFSANGKIFNDINEELNEWQKNNKIQRLWEGDASLWTNSDEHKWLGWLTVIQTELDEIFHIEALARDIKEADFKHIVLLGMGGSSLCPAMIAHIFDQKVDSPRLHVLDSTDPLQILHLEKSIQLNKTFFIVSSKSGSTLEPNLFMQYFYARVQTELEQSNVGNVFMAITDPGSHLEQEAKNLNFKTIFYGIPSIGGRYSALSNFGMVPAGLIGIDLKDFLDSARVMSQACRLAAFPKENPGVLLGIILGVCAKLGNDKITLVVSPDIQALGAWLEQLLAESSGKLGKALIPVDQEPLGPPETYGADRLFVYIRFEETKEVKQDDAIAAIESAGGLVIRLQVHSKIKLGAELFCWEMATAVACSVMGVNAFNQPDVEGSKILAARLIREQELTGKLPSPNFIVGNQGLQILTDVANDQAITRCLQGKLSVEHYLAAYLSLVSPGNYVNLSAFIEMSEEHFDLLQQCRVLIRNAKKVATCLGFGPRFLHSTGQAYKGGPNTGVFIQITADHAEDIQIPGQSYTFGLVINAQAQADFEVLSQRSRRVLRIHLGKDIAAGLKLLYQSLQQALQTH